MTTDKVDPLDRATLRRLLAEATKAPWKAVTEMHPSAVKSHKEAVSLYGLDCLIYTMSRDYLNLPETFERQKVDAELIGALRNAASALLDRLEQVEGLTSEFVAYWLRNGGCGMCGGVPHSTTCYVGRMQNLLGEALAARPVPPAPEGK